MMPLLAKISWRPPTLSGLSLSRGAVANARAAVERDRLRAAQREEAASVFDAPSSSELDRRPSRAS